MKSEVGSRQVRSSDLHKDRYRIEVVFIDGPDKQGKNVRQ